MQFEPAWSLTVITITALAVLYVWYLLAHATIFDRVFAYPREHWGPLWNCPWCIGMWLAAIALIVVGEYDPLTHLATAGAVGMLGSHV